MQTIIFHLFIATMMALVIVAIYQLFNEFNMFDTIKRWWKNKLCKHAEQKYLTSFNLYTVDDSGKTTMAESYELFKCKFCGKLIDEKVHASFAVKTPRPLEGTTL